MTQFDESLQVGIEIVVRWKDRYSYFKARAEVVKVNRKTVNAKLLEHICEYRGGQDREVYASGYVIQVPRMTDRKLWKVIHCAEPLKGWEAVPGRPRERKPRQPKPPEPEG